MAVLLITHDLGIVAQWADPVVVMYAGRSVEQGEPNAIFDRPLHPYTRGLLTASPRLDDSRHYSDGPLNEIPGSIRSGAGEPGCAFAPRCVHARPSCREAVPAIQVLPEGRQVACPVFITDEYRVAAFHR